MPRVFWYIYIKQNMTVLTLTKSYNIVSNIYVFRGNLQLFIGTPITPLTAWLTDQPPSFALALNLSVSLFPLSLSVTLKHLQIKHHTRFVFRMYYAQDYSIDIKQSYNMINNIVIDSRNPSSFSTWYIVTTPSARVGIHADVFKKSSRNLRLLQLIIHHSYYFHLYHFFPDSKVHGANMGPIWGRQDPGGSHVGPMNFVIWVHFLPVSVSFCLFHLFLWHLNICEENIPTNRSFEMYHAKDYSVDIN